MNYKLTKLNDAPLDKDQVCTFAESLKLHPILATLLISRGIDSESAAKRYLQPNPDDFYDPFLLKGMHAAVERIELAIKNHERIVVYGDYDCDGICASAILSLYLSSRGLEVYTHIPNRAGDGYGLNVEAIERIIDNCCPDLILTCDCGISGREEVAHAMDLGVDMIVTDHHEVSDSVPKCIVINPKQIDCNYPYAYLCGAGVAMKLVHALGGLQAAMAYLDLAALATIADLVPLLDENRLIVQLGLAKLGEKSNLGLKTLLNDQKISLPVSSGDVAFKLAPRINAAGRMGDAYRAFELVTTADLAKANEIVLAINTDNIKRKELCDSLYNEAIEDLQFEDLIHNRAIVLSNPTWEKGITGILAARLAGDFRRPSFVMVNSGEQYKGTSRSVPGINIYDLLSSVSDILIEFGGHSQAAGFSIAEKNIPMFKERINAKLADLSEELFEPNIAYDLDVSIADLNLDLARALEVIEPSGNSNTRPLFRTTVNRLQVAPCKSNFNHTNITAENGLQMMAFNFYAQNQFLAGDKPKDLVVELQLNSFGGRESAKAILRAVSPSELFISDSVAKANMLKTLGFLTFEKVPCKTYSADQLPSIVGNALFGTLIIAGSKPSYEAFCALNPNQAFLHEFLYSTTKNNFSRIIVSPEYDDNLLLANYDRIVFLDTPPGLVAASYIRKKTKAEIYVPKDNNESIFYEGIVTSRAEFGRYFEAIRQNESLQSTNILSYFKLLLARVPQVNLSQFIICALVFTELGLLKTEKGNTFGFVVNRDIKRELNDSKIFQHLLKCVPEI